MKQLTGWHPLSDICAALNVSYEPVRLIVQRASAHDEPWVQKKGFPYRWFVNKDHPGYQQQVVNVFTSDDEFLSLPENWNEEPFSSTLQSLPDIAPPSFDVTHSWPELCSWLDRQGVFIFFNALEEDQPSWRWQWGEVSGNGHMSVEDAILAALKTKVAHLQRDVQQERLVTRPRRRWWWF